MKRSKGLQKLEALRHARLQQAENALLRQRAHCDVARAKTEVAGARVATHLDWQERRERGLLGDLIGRPVTVNDIERARATFAVLDEQRADLERAEQDARRSMYSVFRLKDELARERSRLHRDHHKISVLVSRDDQATRRRDELYAEVEQEERFLVASAWGDPLSC